MDTRERAQWSTHAPQIIRKTCLKSHLLPLLILHQIFTHKVSLTFFNWLYSSSIILTSLVRHTPSLQSFFPMGPLQALNIRTWTPSQTPCWRRRPSQRVLRLLGWGGFMSTASCLNLNYLLTIRPCPTCTAGSRLSSLLSRWGRWWKMEGSCRTFLLLLTFHNFSLVSSENRTKDQVRQRWRPVQLDRDEWAG